MLCRKIITKTVEYLFLRFTTSNNTNKDTMIPHSNWKQFPQLHLARTKYPSIGFVGNSLVVAGGACGRKSRKNCPFVETFNASQYKWDVTKNMRLNHIRYHHSTFQISQPFCDMKKWNNAYTQQNSLNNVLIDLKVISEALNI